VAETRLLIARYDTAVAERPDLRPELDPLAAEHDAHLTALLATLPGRESSPTTSPGAGDGTPSTNPTGAGSPTTSSSTTASPGTTGPPVTAAQVRRSLAGDERAAAASRVTQAVAASPALARLIASIGASEAAHVAVLGGRA
jgi:hypothetical protein